MLFSERFNALLKEAEFTKEMLGSGATQIRNANYASKGIYFQAFTSLSTGIERIGKICLLLDYYIDHQGKFPQSDYLKRHVGHNILDIYKKSAPLIKKHSIQMNFLRHLDDPIHQSILKVLSGFAMGDRYSNIDLLVGARQRTDSIAAWFKEVDQPLFRSRVSVRKKKSINWNAEIVA